MGIREIGEIKRFSLPKPISANLPKSLINGEQHDAQTNCDHRHYAHLAICVGDDSFSTLAVFV
jgi:hypothetical protein